MESFQDGSGTPNKFFIFTILLFSSALCYYLMYVKEGSFKDPKW